MSPFKIVMTLLISGAIGYFTNYIAVKMLFRPRTEKHIFGRRVPFTPGIIPKNRGRLAKALGRTVSEQLLTGDDLKNALCSESAADAVSEKITEAVFSDAPLDSVLSKVMGGDRLSAAKDMAQSRITEIAVQKLKEADIGAIVIREGTGAVREKLAGSMLAMFVNDDLIADLAAPIGAKIDDYIDRNAEAMIGSAVSEQLDRLAASSPEALLTGSGIPRDAVKDAAARLYTGAAASFTDALLSSVDISALVEARVNAMSVEDIEELVMSVMKHELNAVISLGALIGIVIGLLNLLL